MQWRTMAWLCLAVTACGQAEVSREAFEAERPADRLAKIDNGDGTYSYALPEDFDPTQLVRGEIITWRYAGQARHAWAPEPPGERTFTVPERTPSTDRERLLATRRVDAQGRVWEVEDVDDEAWARSRSHSPQEDDEPAAVRAPAVADSLVPGTTVTWQPMSWDHDDCDSNNDTHIWNGEGRTAKPNPTGRPRTAVQVDNGPGLCSGVLLDNDEVLTAAHCVSDDNNDPIDVSSVTVCKPDPWACFTAQDIDFSSNYGGGSANGGGTDFDDDWAIIELTSDFPEGPAHQDDHMHLSTNDDAAISALASVHNLSFPGFLDNCVDPANNTVFHNVENGGIADVDGDRIHFTIDGSPGHSGGPLYYCPDGDNDVCSPGDLGWVIAVWAGWNQVSNRFVGPKAAHFESVAMAFVND